MDIPLTSSFPFQLSTLHERFNTSENNTFVNVTSQMSYYQYTVIGISIPFVFIFFVTFVTLIILIIRSNHEMKRNQRWLFALLIALSFASFINLFSRIGAELAFLSSSPIEAIAINDMIKAIDRCIVVAVSLIEFLLVTFVTDVFLQTTRKIGAMSDRLYTNLRRSIISFTVLLAVIIVPMCVLVLIVGGLGVAKVANGVRDYLMMISLIVSALSFAITVILQLSITLVSFKKWLFSSIHRLNPFKYIGALLLRSLKEGETRIVGTGANSAHEPNLGSNNNSLSESLKIKRLALKKALIILVGVTIALVMQFVGFLCIPFAVLNQIPLLFYYVIQCMAVFSMIVLFTVIYRPLSQIQTPREEKKTKE
ncbi:hypothetical protein C9374_009517 [Naegleria lovaniensis]|uniref:Uncharacterized protein n=1 Tax=Naegleria lovaniensis TaxID=51637 RepID=A0AA88H174_NAELO|nr:uncharacterized protein C9374_009517 [Naegleria lovaniensis]KAG2392940.1 hypothetical protein C9374_009517 [Naegleria lovaniensis]